jgi:hypothetical protein
MDHTNGVLQDALQALRQGRVGGDTAKALQGVLTRSLAGLEEVQVSVFLDVATVLRGQPLDAALAVWRAWHDCFTRTEFDELEMRSLLGVDEEGRLVMHDVLVALGRGIILTRTAGFKEHYGSRVWVEGGKVEGCKQVGFLVRACTLIKCRVAQLEMLDL